MQKAIVLSNSDEFKQTGTKSLDPQFCLPLYEPEFAHGFELKTHSFGWFVEYFDWGASVWNL